MARAEGVPPGKAQGLGLRVLIYPRRFKTPKGPLHVPERRAGTQARLRKVAAHCYLSLIVLQASTLFDSNKRRNNSNTNGDDDRDRPKRELDPVRQIVDVWERR